MKILLLFTILLLPLSIIKSQAPYNRKMLETALSEVNLEEALIPKDKWHPYPTYNDSIEWDALPQNLKTALVKNAESYLDKDWGYLPANLFLEYQRSGNRTKYEKVTFFRREALTSLVLGELIERKGRFIDKITDGIWVICEESSWDIPAHEAGHKGRIFPDPEDPLVALFSAETAATLAWTDFLIGGELDEVSPMLRKRIYLECQARVLTPALEKEDKFWMGFTTKWVNNWNPWINSNWLATNLLLEKDPIRRIAAVKRSLLSVDNFINMYGEDGGCDEGPMYYTRAAASLFDCLEIVHSATNGKIDIFNEPLINAMADYIRKAHIDGNYFLNFADAAAVGYAKGGLVYRFGEAVHNADLTNFGLFAFQNNGIEKECFTQRINSFGRVLPNIFLYEKITDLNADYVKVTDAWLPDLQVAISISSEKKQLFFAAKGGHNAESHNHNDVGNFILYANNKPIIIDVGVEEYTRKTFSPERYSIWTMQSQYHNLPTINGKMEKDGKDYKAKVINYKSDKTETQFVLDIASAYPEEAKIDYWQRSFNFSKKGELNLTDKYKIDNKEGITWNFMAYANIKVEPGKLILTSKADDNEKLIMIFDSSIFNVEFEEIEITDTLLKKSWKGSLTRMKFTQKSKSNEGEAKFIFRGQ